MKEITLQLLKREFPMVVTPEEETRVRKAATMVQSRIDTYRQQYAIGDDLYLALMCCLDIATEHVAQAEGTEGQHISLVNRLRELDQYLATALEAVDR